MACLCEVVRLSFYLGKKAKAAFAAKSGAASSMAEVHPTDAAEVLLDYSTLSQGAGQGDVPDYSAHQSRGLVLCCEEEDPEAPPAFQCRMDLLRCCIVLYHIACAGLVALATSNDWISAQDGGSFAWELWALWQQLCLWTLFVQNLVRCLTVDTQALQISTVKSVLLYTVPGVSEISDTMKDWVVVGMCFLKPHTGIGLVAGVSFVLLDGYFSRIGACQWIRITDRILMRPPVFVLQVLWVLVILTVHEAGIWLVCFALSIWPVLLLCCIDMSKHLALQRMVQESPYPFLVPFCCPLLFYILSINRPAIEAMCTWLGAEGGLLAIPSIYVILYSYTMVNLHPECAKDLRKAYFAISGLPLQSAQLQSSADEGCIKAKWDWMKREARILWMDLLSSSRLMIAWAEDWPQGLIGLVFVARFRRRAAGFGFASLSALVSLSKGILIPALQQYAFRQQKDAVFKALDGLLHPQLHAAQEYAAKLYTTAGTRMTRPDAKRTLYGLLAELSEEVLKGFQVRERDLLQPILTFHETWLQEIEFGGLASVVMPCLAELYIQDGTPREELFDLGFVKEANFSSKDCKAAGYHVADCREAGFSLGECREAGYSVAACTKSGVSLSECRVAGYHVEECIQAGHNLRECREGGYRLKDCLAAAFSLQQCRKAGFTVRECFEAGFNKVACQRAGFSNRDLVLSGLKDEDWDDLAGSSQE